MIQRSFGSNTISMWPSELFVVSKFMTELKWPRSPSLSKWAIFCSCRVTYSFTHVPSLSPPSLPPSLPLLSLDKNSRKLNGTWKDKFMKIFVFFFFYQGSFVTLKGKEIELLKIEPGAAWLSWHYRKKRKSSINSVCSCRAHLGNEANDIPQN